MQHEIVTQVNKALKETGEYPDTVELYGTTLRKATKLRQFLNSVFGSETVVAAYDMYSGFDKGVWDMAGCYSVIITKEGNVVVVTNSEWGRMSFVGAVRN